MARFRVSGDLLVAFVINDMEADSLDAAVKLVEEGDEEVRALMSTDSVEDSVVEVHDSEEINERGECISKPTGLLAPSLYADLLSAAECHGFVSDEAKEIMERLAEMIKEDPRSEEDEDA